MAKRIGLVFILITLALTLCSCGNRDHWDTVFRYDHAIIQLADGTVVEGKCQNWRDYENSDMMQIKVGDKTYLVHSTNCTLIAE